MNSQLLTSYICSSVSCLRKWHHHPCLQLLKPESWELAMFPLSLCHFSHLINHNIWGVTHVSPSSELLTSSRLPNFISFASKIPLIFSPQCLCVCPGQANVILDLQYCKSLLTGLLACDCLFECYHWTVYYIEVKIRTVLSTTLFIVSITAWQSICQVNLL